MVEEEAEAEARRAEARRGGDRRGECIEEEEEAMKVKLAEFWKAG